MPEIQAMLDQVNQNGGLHLMANETPMLDFVLSQENKNAFRIEPLMSTDGKLRNVEIKFTQAMLEDEVQEDLTGCEATGEYCEKSKLYSFDPDKNFGSTIKLGVGELKENSEQNTAVISLEVQKRMNAIKERLATELATVAAVGAGAWGTDVADEVTGAALVGDILNVNTTLLNGTDARPVNSVLFEQLRTAARLSRFGASSIFGRNELPAYVRRAIGGDADGLGYNLRAMLENFGMGATYDRYLANVLKTTGDADNLMVGIGSIAPVTWSLYDSDGARINSADSIAETIVDPMSGLRFEYRMTRPCDDWEIQIRLRTQFFLLPDDLYKTGSPYFETNGIGQIKVVCDDLTPCAS